MTVDDARRRLRAALEGTNQRAWANAHGVNRSHVCEFLHGRRLPTTAILKGLGLEVQIIEPITDITSQDLDVGRTLFGLPVEVSADVPDGVILFKDAIGNTVGKIDFTEEPKREDDVAP